jgi:hypothetical protein
MPQYKLAIVVGKDPSIVKDVIRLLFPRSYMRKYNRSAQRRVSILRPTLYREFETVRDQQKNVKLSSITECFCGMAESKEPDGRCRDGSAAQKEFFESILYPN